MTVNEYLDNMLTASGTKLVDGHSIYSGKSGHMRFARECGHALNDFSNMDQKQLLQVSYSRLYVRACFLKPLLNASEWIQAMIKGK